ncbi:alpha/beta hydrolase [Microbacterium saperdae]
MSTDATPETIAPLRGSWAPEFAARLSLVERIDANLLDPSAEFVAAVAAFGAPMGEPERHDIEVDDLEVPGPHGAVGVRRYRLRGSETRGAAVWIHGGGFVSGDLDMPEADTVARTVAAASDVVVFSIDYRLCVDGVTHPVPHDDCWAAYSWCVDNAEVLGVDASRIVLGGASAGGNLAASVALRAAAERRSPAKALLIYPVLHAPLPLPDAELAACLAQTPDALRFLPHIVEVLNANFLGNASVSDPSAFPGAGTDFAGFPPTYIEACEFDDLRSSASRFVAQLSDAGVPVDYVVAAGAPHGFLNVVGSDTARASMARIAAAVSEAVAS